MPKKKALTVKGTPEGQKKLAEVKAKLVEAAKTPEGQARIAELKPKLVEFKDSPEFAEVLAIMDGNKAADAAMAQDVAQWVTNIKAMASTPEGKAQLQARGAEIKAWAAANPTRVDELVTQLRETELSPTGKEVVAQVKALLGKK